ncbi:tape measure protein [Mycobacterium marinum]|uniref:tape measure protein n=1 Tax=Mycobacterium marinum TaxID=1781 RepID=UPI0035695853
MVIHADVLARLNERAADQVASQLEARFRVAGERSSQAFSQALTARSAIDQAVTQFAAHGQRAARGFGSGFGSELTRALPVVSGFSSAMAGYETVAGKSGALAGRAFGMAFTTAAAGLVGAAGYTLFKGFERYEAIDAAKNRLDNLNRTLTATGKQALDVGAVMDTVNQVVLDTPFKLDEAFSVATRALASSTGDLQRFMTDVSNAAGFTGSSISDIGDAFLKIANQGHVSMQEINNQLQQLPIVPWLADTLTGGDVPKLAKMIHDNKVGLEALLTTVEQHAPGFAKAMNNTVVGSIENVKTSISRLGANFLGAIFGKPAEDANQLVDVLHSLRDRFDDVGKWVTDHQGEIHEFFQGAAKVAQELLTPLGKIATTLADHKGLIEGAAKAYIAWESIKGIAAVIAGLERIDLLLKGMPASAAAAGGAMGGMGGAAGARVGPGLLGLIPPVATIFGTTMGGNWIANQLQGTDRSVWWPIQQGLSMPGKWMGQWWDDQNAKSPAPHRQLPPPTINRPIPQVTGQEFANIPPGTDINGPWGVNPELDALRRAMGFSPGQIIPQAPGLVPKPPPAHNFYKDWYKPEGGGGPAGSPILDPTGASGASGPRLPKAPVVPFDMSVPPGIPGLPQTAATYSAETSFLESRHRLAEKRARLNQLEHTANATAEDILDARNDVLEAQRSQQQAEMRLAEARQNELEKYTKHMRQGADTLGEIGAQLDQDFGISKGLAGIAENITKFIANLAAAPVIGALSGVQQGLGYKPGEAGSGLLAMAAGAGAFGPQHQVLPYGGQYPYAAAGMPAAGVGMPGTPNLAGVSYGVPAGANIYSGPHTTDTHGALTPRAAALRSLISQMFGVTNIGGYRPPDPPFNEHSSGEALDIMVGDNAALGDQINQFLQDNAGPLGLEYSLWQQQQWTPGQGPTPMRNRGSGTQNHRDHVHARVRPGPLAGGGGQVAPSGWGGAAPTGGGPGWWGGGTPGAPGGGDSPIPGAPGTPGVPFPGTQSPLVPGGGGPGLPGQGRGPMTPGRGRYPGEGLNIPKSDGISINGGFLGLLQQAIPTAVNAAVGAAGAAGGMAAPGAGAGAGAAGAIMAAAAQIGIDEINRAINFGGQAVGTLAQGFGETFIPNESALADFSGGWFGRIAGAVAGVNAQVPNIAGQVGQAINGATGGQGLPPGLTPEQVAGNPDQRSGDQGGQNVTNNTFTTNINGASIPNENSMGNSVTMAQTAMWQR